MLLLVLDLSYVALAAVIAMFCSAGAIWWLIDTVLSWLPGHWFADDDDQPWSL